MRSNVLSASVIVAMILGSAAIADTYAATPPVVPAVTAAPAATTPVVAASTTPATTPAATPAKTPVMVAASPSDVSGVITSINTKHLIVMIGGLKYHLPKGFDLSGFKVGEKVNVTFTLSGNKHEVSKMAAAV